MADNSIILFDGSITGEQKKLPLNYLSLSGLTEGVTYKKFTKTYDYSGTEYDILAIEFLNGESVYTNVIGTDMSPSAPNQLIDPAHWEVNEIWDDDVSANIFYGKMAGNFMVVTDDPQPSNWISKWKTIYYQKDIWPSLDSYPEMVGSHYCRAEFQNPFNLDDGHRPDWVEPSSMVDTDVDGVMVGHRITRLNQFQKIYYLSNGNMFGCWRGAIRPSYLDYKNYRFVSGIFGAWGSGMNDDWGNNGKFSAHIYGPDGNDVTPYKTGYSYDTFWPVYYDDTTSIQVESDCNTYMGMGVIEYDGKQYIGTLLVHTNPESGLYDGAKFNGWAVEPFWNKVLIPNLPSVNWNVPQNTAGGGEGSYDFGSESMVDTNGAGTQSYTALNSFVSMSAQGLTWGVFDMDGIKTVLNKLKTRDNISKLLEKGAQTNVFESLRTLHMIPGNPNIDSVTTPRTQLNIAGIWDINVNFKELTQRNWIYEFDEYSTVDNEGNSKFSDTFLDFAPYTSAKLYLPFIGTVSLDVNSFMGGKVKVTYHIDAITGDCIARVKLTNKYGNSVENDFSGNCAWDLPFQTGDSRFERISSSISAGANIITGVTKAAAGNAKGISDILSGAQTLAANSLAGHASYSSVNGNSSCMGNLNVALELYLPNNTVPDNYAENIGYISKFGGTVGKVTAGAGEEVVITGHAVYSNVDVSGIPEASDEEKAEIKRLLEEGVWL